MELLGIVVPLVLFGLVTSVIVGLVVSIMLFTKKPGTARRLIGSFRRLRNREHLRRPGRLEHGREQQVAQSA